MVVAPRIGNDVSYVAQINHESHFAWQAQYLVTIVIWVWFACQACRCGRPVACCCLMLCK